MEDTKDSPDAVKLSAAEQKSQLENMYSKLLDKAKTKLLPKKEEPVPKKKGDAMFDDK